MAKRQHLAKAAPRLDAAAPDKAAVDSWRKAQSALKSGTISEALFWLRLCVEQDPQHVDAWSQMGLALKSQGDLAGATYAYRSATCLRPDVAATLFKLADLLRRQGCAAEALEICERGFALNAAVGEGHIVRAMVFKALGRLDESIRDLRQVLASNARSTAIRILLVDSLIDADRLDEAVADLNHGLRFDPNASALHERLAAVYVKQKNFDAAIVSSRKVIGTKLGDAEAYRKLGWLYQEQGRTQDALDTYAKAISVDPTYHRAHTNLASLLLKADQLDRATSIFRHVTMLASNDATSFYNLGFSLRLQGAFGDAAHALQQALRLRPDYPEALAELCHIRQHFCDWDGLKEQQNLLKAAAARHGTRLTPFQVMTWMESPADQLHYARLWARQLTANAPKPLSSYAFEPDATADRRIRIGYVSSDFQNHATAMLMAELLECHDTTRFAVVGYSFGRDDGSTMRQRVAAAFETFVDLHGLSNPEATRRIHADKIDILIDLKGYTQGARTEIFAALPAPIQVSYLGYPGKMGADFIDYIIVDAVVAPNADAPFFDEKLVHLPYSYQPNDRRRAVASEGPTRVACGLPENGFVFCCLNNTYKITSDIFDIWMRVLQQTPGSVLWLLQANGVATENLRREAVARGVAADRIVFAPRLETADHLARLRLADLFLDTLPVNAHTTASEALWVGLPVLTCAGQTFIARVAASLLGAVGLSDLVTTSLADYEATALRLAAEPARLERYRDALIANRYTAPLFDIERYTRNFEAALQQMFAMRKVGIPPQAFAVANDGSVALGSAS